MASTMEAISLQHIHSEPYTLSLRGAELYFGIKEKTFRNWIHEGRLRRGYHYRKVGGKVLLIRDKFIEYMEQEDGCTG